MSKVAILFGVFLIALGVAGYLGTVPKAKPGTAATGGDTAQAPAAVEPAQRSLTALIPAGFGVLLLICGGLGLKPERRKLAMHLAAGVAMLGVVLGGGRFASKIPSLFNGDPEINRRAVLFTGILAIICLVYLILSVRSFIAARKRKPA